MLRIIDLVLVFAWYGFVVLGSLAKLVSMRRGRLRYFGQTAALPIRWTRWLLGEDSLEN